MKYNVVLASASPRRSDLLSKIGMKHTVAPADVEENHHPDFTPEQSAIENARKKVLASSAENPGSLVLGADTIVVLGNGRILGKPGSAAEAAEMLNTLSDSWHTVVTGVALYNPAAKAIITAYDKTEVRFNPMTENEISWYISTGEPMDKAGAYGLQEKGMIFVREVNGSPSNVIGLPVQLVYALFKNAGLSIEDYLN